MVYYCSEAVLRLVIGHFEHARSYVCGRNSAGILCHLRDKDTKHQRRKFSSTVVLLSVILLRCTMVVVVKYVVISQRFSENSPNEFSRMVPFLIPILVYRNTFISWLCSTEVLPLCLFPPQKPLQHSYPLFQRAQPHIELLLALRRIISQFDIEVFSVRRRRHRGTEYRLYKETVVRFQGIAVRAAKGGRELVGRVDCVVA